MKKVLAIVLSAIMLISAVAVNVVAAPQSVTETVSATFQAYSTGNIYDTLKEVSCDDGIVFRTSGVGSGHVDITGLIEQVAPLETVSSVSVTLEAVDHENFAPRQQDTDEEGVPTGKPIIGLKGVYSNNTDSYDISGINWGVGENPYTMSGNITEGTAAVYIDTSSHGVIPQDEPWTFKVTAEVTYTPEGKVRIGDEYFDTLVEAVDAAESGDTIYLLEDMEGAGIGIFAPDVKDFTIDFGGNTYTCVGSPVGSSGTQSQAFHLEKSAEKTPNVKLQNGTLTATTGSGVYMLIQNYCNLTLTNMNLIGTTDTRYVVSNNFGNTLINGTTSITAKPGTIAFDVCYANGSYADGVSVTVDTTGTIKGDIKLGTWNAAGGSNPKPDINDYLEKAKLTINNVKLEGKIINNVDGDYVPDREVYSSPATLGLFVSNIVDAANVATATVPGPGTYTFEATFDGEGIAYDWIMVKEHLSAGWTLNGTTIPQGTIVKFTGLNINGSDIDLTSDNRTFTVGEQGTLEAAYYNTHIGAGSKPTDRNITSISVTIEIVENEKSPEQIAAELKDKLTKTVEIKGGIFAADSNVKEYLPEGEYETDKDGNTIVGDVQLPSVNMHDNNRITGCIYLNEKYHALIVNGRFIAQPHVDNGTGFCVACKGAINK